MVTLFVVRARSYLLVLSRLFYCHLTCFNGLAAGNYSFVLN